MSTPLPDGFGSAAYPGLALDGNGNPVVLFELFGDGVRRSTGLALVRSDDGGRTFTPPATMPRGGEQAAGVNGGRQGRLMDKLAVTADGVMVVVNSTFEENAASHVWLMRSK